METARITLGYTRITAPITGKIGRSYLTQGALVEANQDQALATIQTLDPIYVDMNQSSSELLALRRAVARREGDGSTTANVTLTLDDGTAYPHQGTFQFQRSVGGYHHRLGNAARAVPESGRRAAAGNVRARDASSKASNRMHCWFRNAA